MSRVVDDQPAVRLVWPTGEERERFEILALHSRGDERTPEEERYRSLIAKHGPASDPDLTSDVYSDFLSLHAKDDDRSDEEETRYREVGDRFSLHGRSELRQFNASPRAIRPSCRPVRHGRAPRSRRFHTARTSRGSPRRTDDGDDEPDHALTVRGREARP